MDTRNAWLDADVILRLLVRDGSPRLHAAAARIFDEAAAGRLKLRLSPLVVGECTHLLARFYGGTRAETRKSLMEVMSHPGVRCDQQRLVLHTLELWVERPGLDFVDCHLIATSTAAREAIATLDDGIARSGLVPIVDGST